MSEERIHPRPYLKLLLLAALLGLICAVITFIFLVLVRAGQSLIWEQAAHAAGLPAPVFTLLICTLGGLVVGVIAFVLLSGSFFGALYVFPDYQPSLNDLLLAVPLGLLGALVGAIFIFVFDLLRIVMQPLHKRLIVRRLIGGVGLGLAAHLIFPALPEAVAVASAMGGAMVATMKAPLFSAPWRPRGFR